MSIPHHSVIKVVSKEPTLYDLLMQLAATGEIGAEHTHRIGPLFKVLYDDLDMSDYLMAQVSLYDDSMFVIHLWNRERNRKYMSFDVPVSVLTAPDMLVAAREYAHDQRTKELRSQIEAAEAQIRGATDRLSKLETELNQHILTKDFTV